MLGFYNSLGLSDFSFAQQKNVCYAQSVMLCYEREAYREPCRERDRESGSLSVCVILTTSVVNLWTCFL